MALYYDAPKDSPLYDAAQKIKLVIEKFTDTSDKPIELILPPNASKTTKPENKASGGTANHTQKRIKNVK